MSSTTIRHVILASTSPRRRELLASLNIGFDIVPSHADENTPNDWSPAQIVTELAKRKAEAVYHSLDSSGRSSSQGSIIIGSDTIVVRDGEVLGKPKNEAEAASMIASLQGRSHTVYTGVACMDSATGELLVDFRSTEVTMRSLTSEEVLAYARTGEGLDKAGAYAIQGLGATLVTGIQGCYFNVVGLPLSLLAEMLGHFGIQVLDAPQK
ncbi:Septum formation protein Maf [compost metagenome]